MNTIKLNDAEFEVINYNKNTYFTGEDISSSAACAIVVENINVLTALAENPITSIQIYHNNDLIYNLQNITARIMSINEYLNNDRISIDVNLSISNT